MQGFDLLVAMFKPSLATAGLLVVDWCKQNDALYTVSIDAICLRSVHWAAAAGAGDDVTAGAC